MSRNRIYLAIVFAAALQVAALAEAKGSFERTLNVTGTPDVDVSTGSGNITIRSGAAGTVSVRARIHASTRWFGGDGMSAEEKVRRIEKEPPIRQDGNVITIGKIEDRELRRNVSIDYDITLPANTKLQSRTGSGDMSIQGTVGPLRAETGSGGIRVAQIAGEARVETGSGDVRIDEVKGRLYARTGSGNITADAVEGGLVAETGSGDIHYRQTAAADVSARTGSGNVDLRNVRGGVEAHTGSGDLEIDGEARGNWDLSSGSGNINVRLPQQAQFEINARSSSGSVEIAHPVTVQGTIRPNRLQGKVGAGGVLISASTGSGDIRIQ